MPKREHGRVPHVRRRAQSDDDTRSPGLLAREQVRATFFLTISTSPTVLAPLVRRMFADGHVRAMHSRTRRDMLMSPDGFAKMLVARADVSSRSRASSCPASARTPGGAAGRCTRAETDRSPDGRWGGIYGTGMVPQAQADAIVKRVGPRISNGEIVVMHDGDESAPLVDQRHRWTPHRGSSPAPRPGLTFGVVCENVTDRIGNRVSGN